MAEEDSLIHLEDVFAETNLSWVKSQNEETVARVTGYEDFKNLQADARAILDSKDRIPFITRRGDFVFNFWEDDKYPRGVWRRTSLESYKTKSPVWEDLLDVDVLGKKEGKSWTYSRADVHTPSGRALLSLSEAASDAVVIREFDLNSKTFVEGPTSFCVLKTAKTRITFVNENQVLVCSDFGAGSLTKSGYPRICKLWNRGESLETAKVVFSADESDVSVHGYVSRCPPFAPVTIVGRSPSFYTSEEHVVRADGSLVKIPKPDSANVSVWGERVLVELRAEWGQWEAGCLLVGKLEEFLAKGESALQVLFRPTATAFMESFIETRNYVVVAILDNVVGRLEEFHLDEASGQWKSRKVNAPSPGSLQIQSLQDSYSSEDALADAYVVTYRDFLTPTTLFMYKAGQDQSEVLKTLVPFFDATGMKATQYTAKSKDGTVIPYFVVFPKNVDPEGDNACLLYGYGGFENAMTPFYSGMYGRCWMSRGGVFVMANIRGGGEFGPKWHQSALKGNRQRCYDDFAAVAEDLIQRKVTKASRLVIEGGSNGGLLVAAVMLQRPELFSGVVCQCPLIDMRRYHKLHAGASWMEEYGDPDTDDWNFLQKYSPYHNVPEKSKQLPQVLFTTSTRDDRVHPAHARKIYHKMRGHGHQGTFLYENIEGGHSNAADNNQRAWIYAMEFSFMWLAVKK